MRKERFGTVAIAALMSLLAGQAAHAATLSLADVPLFLTPGAEPNIMMMFDNSGSMANIVPDTPYDPATTYGAPCPTANQIAAGTQVELNISGTSPRINYSTTDYIYGTTGGNRCFVPTASYLASLNNGATGYLPAQYTGNYLNWYFSTATDPTGCTPASWSGAQRKPCTKSRLEIAKTAGVGLVTTMPAGMRAGLSTYNDGDGGQLLQPVGLLDPTKKAALTGSINGMAASGNTPLAETFADIGFYFSNGATNLVLHPGGTPSTQTRANVFTNSTRHSSWTSGSGLTKPVQYACQKSFAVLLTDGRPQGDRAISSHIRDYTGDCAAGLCNATPNTTNLPAGPLPTTGSGNGTKKNREYEQQGSDYLDDVAAALYDMDLRPDLPKTAGQKNNITSYFVSFADDQAINDPLMQNAADQGGGQKFVAGNETDLITAFQAALSDIEAKSASASSASVNSGSINSGTRLFQAKFDSTDWSGRLLGRSVGGDGTLGAEFEATLPGPGSRAIITVDSTGAGVPFLWANIGATRQGELQPSPSDGFGSKRLLWLRGSTTDDPPAPNGFRPRTVFLGDIVNSAPAFVGAPAFRYPDNLETAPYSTFRANNQSRDHMVYVGANDGMLHGFFTDDRPLPSAVPTPGVGTGAVTERLAFIPGAVFKNLHKLTAPGYTHQYFVDGTPVTGDAFVGGAWKTMLVAGLNKGGQSIFALDVTDPSTSNFTQGNASSIFKWEFTDVNDKDLGYTFSRPSIVRMNSGVWAAGFGNGYNNTFSDGAATTSTSGNAVLYINNLTTGVNIAKIDTGVGASVDPTSANRPNGLSTPVFVDVNGDNNVDIAYAGDLFGNLWKFNLSSAAPGSWVVSYSGVPLFVAKDSTGKRQPITTRPNVSRGPLGVGLIVVFGTGKYIETTDTALGTPQTFYGLLDPNTGGASDKIAGRANLTAQTVTKETATLRVTSANALGGTSRGWYLDLLPPSPAAAQGEMQVTDALIRNGHVVFTTLVPDTSACGFGGTSWLMEMNLFTGAKLAFTPFDLNNNQIFGDDKYTEGGVDYEPSGVKTTVGITPKPAPLAGDKCDYLIFPGTTGGTETRCRDPGPRGFGRQSWRQAH